jgi:tRNA(adenine34) deaminase
MALALEQARKAAQLGEVPVGAVVVSAGQVVGQAHNLREANQDVLGHAELLALREASRTLGSWRIPKSTLYVTLEPCIMCAGAILQARVDRVIFGCRDEKAGGARSLYALLEDPRMNHRVQVIEGIEAQACQELLQSFFADLRRARKTEA